ncbi:MAG: sugar phosphate isomerase/epimerase family protein [Gemmatimonadota bacterium]
MRIICASICYRGWAEDEVAATLEHAPRIGYRLMEVHGPRFWSVDAVDRFDLAGMGARIRASGMGCAGLYPPGWGGADDAEVGERARAIARAAGYAEALGADHLATTGAQPRKTPGALGRVIECVRRVVEAMPARCGVKLALEPHLGNVLERPEDFEAVLDAVPDPRVGLCIDTGHFHAAGVDLAAAVRRFAGRTWSVHLKDHVGAVSVGIGRGEIDLAGAVAALRETGYPGDLTVELEVEDPQNLPRYTEEAFFYISGLLGAKLPERGAGGG